MLPAWSVARDWRRVSPGSDCHWCSKRTQESRTASCTIRASVQVAPLSVETSTRAIPPLPDHANPAIVCGPAFNVDPVAGAVMIDLTGIGVVVAVEVVIDQLQPNDPLGRGDRAPTGDEQTNRSAMRGRQIPAVHLPGEQYVRAHRGCHWQPAPHPGEIAALRDDL